LINRWQSQRISVTSPNVSSAQFNAELVVTNSPQV
jgi:hypothetical protein